MDEKKSSPFSGIYKEGEPETENIEPTITKPRKPRVPSQLEDVELKISPPTESNHKVEFVTKDQFEAYSPVPFEAFNEQRRRIEQLEMAVKAMRGLVFLAIILGGASYIKARKTSSPKKKAVKEESYENFDEGESEDS